MTTTEQERERELRLYKVNSQQWFSLEEIAAVDDFGADLEVTLKGGRKYRISYSKRDEFLGLVRSVEAEL
ncbi:hypothetical protein FY145_01115 [Agrobacterium tumefaciens]|uniref:hypothetical protein n=1 Tax=Agrobacterium tumefaciens TaxID=358 RepID=UPI0021CFF77A|nr:hypothetical protein [Agrobacterium tumefaciens]UXS69174.1 hypothetical protein FY146_01115 [Agrobacterium tumefaciens]UXS76837.1 hypothetical protein FY145_01115 [Agrobacterium tumefaciens]